MALQRVPLLKKNGGLDWGGGGGGTNWGNGNLPQEIARSGGQEYLYLTQKGEEEKGKSLILSLQLSQTKPPRPGEGRTKGDFISYTEVRTTSEIGPPLLHKEGNLRKKNHPNRSLH